MGRVTWGKGRGIWKPSPGRERQWSGQNRRKTTSSVHLSTECQREETVGESEQGASKQASNRAPNSASLDITEQYRAASPLRDQIKIAQGTTSSKLHELLVKDFTVSLELR